MVTGQSKTHKLGTFAWSFSPRGASVRLGFVYVANRHYTCITHSRCLVTCKHIAGVLLTAKEIVQRRPNGPYGSVFFAGVLCQVEDHICYCICQPFSG